ncbi:MAG: pilus assembly protein PilP, partial [Microcystaceae cyanobacterium]
ATLISAKNRYYLENGIFLAITRQDMESNNHDLEVTIYNPKYKIRTTLANNYNAVRVKAVARRDHEKSFKNYTAGLHYAGSESVSIICQTHEPGGDIVGLVNLTLSSSDKPGAECDPTKGREIR